MALAWKAGWVNALGGSNPPTSASATPLLLGAAAFVVPGDYPRSMLRPRFVSALVASCALLALAACGGEPDLVEPQDAAASQLEPGTAVPTELASLVEQYNATASPVPEPTDDAGGDEVEEPPLRLGADVGWPQCPKGTGIPEKQGQGQPMPVDEAEFVIVGLTNSPSFTRNPCLAEQLDWIKERDLWAAAYSVVSFPSEEEVEAYGADGPWDGTTRLGALRNVGYAAAEFNVATMREHDFDSPIVWIDVEPVPKFEWSNDTRANAAVIVGMARGYREAGYRIGAYSLESMWSSIAGDLRLYVPEWRPAGGTGEAEAVSRCGKDWQFQGGDAVLAQWVEDGRDHNVVCPGVLVEPERWFHRW